MLLLGGVLAIAECGARGPIDDESAAAGAAAAAAAEREARSTCESGESSDCEEMMGSSGGGMDDTGALTVFVGVVTRREAVAAERGEWCNFAAL